MTFGVFNQGLDFWCPHSGPGLLASSFGAIRNHWDSLGNHWEPVGVIGAPLETLGINGEQVGALAHPIGFGACRESQDSDFSNAAFY